MVTLTPLSRNKEQGKYMGKKHIAYRTIFTKDGERRHWVAMPCYRHTRHKIFSLKALFRRIV